MNQLFQKELQKVIQEDLDKFVQDKEKEEDEVLAADAEKEAFVDSLDGETDPDEFDINPGSYRQLTKENIEVAKEWIRRLNDFSNMINDVNNDQSLNAWLHAVDTEGSPFRGIVRSQGKRVTRIAEETAALAEHLEAAVIGSDKKMKDLLQQFPNIKN